MEEGGGDGYETTAREHTRLLYEAPYHCVRCKCDYPPSAEETRCFYHPGLYSPPCAESWGVNGYSCCGKEDYEPRGCVEAPDGHLPEPRLDVVLVISPTKKGRLIVNESATLRDISQALHLKADQGTVTFKGSGASLSLRLLAGKSATNVVLTLTHQNKEI